MATRQWPIFPSLLLGLAQDTAAESREIALTLGMSGPLWRLLRFAWMRPLHRTRFHRPSTSWDVPNPRRKLL